LALTGCTGIINPYLRSTKLDNDLVISHQIDMLPDGKPADGKPAVKAKPIVTFAGDIADAVDAASDQRSLYFDALTNQARLRNATGAAIIGLSALTVYRGISGADSDSTKHLVAKAGGLSAAAYGIGTFFSNKDAESAYLSGYRAVTCAILSARPFLISKDEFDIWKDQVEELDSEIDKTDALLVRLQSLRRQEIESVMGEKTFHHSVDEDLSRAKKGVKNSRNLLKIASAFQHRVNTAGFTLRRRVELIIASVSENIQGSERDIIKLDGLLANAQTLTKGFSEIKPVPLIIEMDSDHPDGSPSSPDTSKFLAIGKSKKHNGPKPATAQSKLGQDADNQVLKVEALNAQVKELQDDKRILQLAAKGIVPAKPEKKVQDTDRANLMDQLSDLYSQHRKVNTLLAGVHSLYQSVRDIPGCKAPGQAILSVSPDVSEMSVAAGQTYPFSILGGTGIPRASLVGTKDENIKLTMHIESGVVVAKVEVLPDAQEGTTHLIITDASGTQKEEITLNITPKPEKP
jgi:hypothetical protein